MGDEDAGGANALVGKTFAMEVGKSRGETMGPLEQSFMALRLVKLLETLRLLVKEVLEADIHRRR